MRRAGVTLAGVVVALACVTAVGGAQQPVPTVGVTAGPTAVSVQAAGALPSGPTRFEVTRQGGGDLSVYVFLLNPGVSLEELQAAFARDERQREGESALGLVWVQASVSFAAGETRRAVTFTLRPGLTYYVLSEPGQEGGGPRQASFTSFTTSGAANGATAPAPAATVRMAGHRFRGARTLPRQGVVRFANVDGDEHFALAVPLRRGVTRRQFGRAVRSESDRLFGRVVAGPPYMLQDILGGGNTVNDQEVQLRRAGRYGLVCFLHEHQSLGMYRIVTVR